MLYIKMEKILIEFGMHLREMRKERGLSQEQLSEMAGLHRTYLGSLERGERNPTLVTLSKIAYALSVTISELTDPKFK